MNGALPPGAARLVRDPELLVLERDTMMAAHKNECPAATGQFATQNISDSIIGDPPDDGKTAATLIACLALAGVAVHQVDDGYLACRWNFARHCLDLRALAGFAKLVGTNGVSCDPQNISFSMLPNERQWFGRHAKNAGQARGSWWLERHASVADYINEELRQDLAHNGGRREF